MEHDIFSALENIEIIEKTNDLSSFSHDEIIENIENLQILHKNIERTPDISKRTGTNKERIQKALEKLRDHYTNESEKQEFSWDISTIQDGHGICSELKNILIHANYTETDVLELIVAFDEIITNAVIHGNKSDDNMHVYIHAVIQPHKATITVEDEGNGFEPETIPNPTDFTRLMILFVENKKDEYTHGRGIWLARRFTDSLTYNKKGNCATLVKNRSLF